MFDERIIYKEHVLVVSKTSSDTRCTHPQCKCNIHFSCFMMDITWPSKYICGGTNPGFSWAVCVKCFEFEICNFCLHLEYSNVPITREGWHEHLLHWELIDGSCVGYGCKTTGKNFFYHCKECGKFTICHSCIYTTLRGTRTFDVMHRYSIIE